MNNITKLGKLSYSIFNILPQLEYSFNCTESKHNKYSHITNFVKEIILQSEDAAI